MILQTIFYLNQNGGDCFKPSWYKDTCYVSNYAVKKSLVAMTCKIYNFFITWFYNAKCDFQVEIWEREVVLNEYLCPLYGEMLLCNP